MTHVYLVKSDNIIADMKDGIIGSYIDKETEKKVTNIHGVYLTRESAVKNMRNIAKQKDSHDLNRTIGANYIVYEGERDGKYYKIAYYVKECTIIEAVED